MLTMNDDLEGALEKYLKLLEQEAYFEAHEVLEEAWHPLRLSDNPLANLVKGLINAAIAFEHIKRNKKKVRNKAKRVIASYERHKYLCVEGIVHEREFFHACQKIEILKIKYVSIFNN